MKLTDYYKNNIFLKIFHFSNMQILSSYHTHATMNTEEYTGLSYWSRSPAHWYRSPEVWECCVSGRWWMVKTGCWCRILRSAGFHWPVQRWQQDRRPARLAETDALATAACSAQQLYPLQKEHKQQVFLQSFQVFLEVNQPHQVSQQNQRFRQFFCWLISHCCWPAESRLKCMHQCCSSSLPACFKEQWVTFTKSWPDVESTLLWRRGGFRMLGNRGFFTFSSPSFSGLMLFCACKI